MTKQYQAPGFLDRLNKICEVIEIQVDVPILHHSDIQIFGEMMSTFYKTGYEAVNKSLLPNKSMELIY